MYDIQTEAYLRRNNPRDNGNDTTPIVPVLVGATLILWTAVLIAAL